MSETRMVAEIESALEEVRGRQWYEISRMGRLANDLPEPTPPDVAARVHGSLPSMAAVMRS
jgi:hypothetical protein